MKGFLVLVFCVVLFVSGFLCIHRKTLERWGIAPHSWYANEVYQTVFRELGEGYDFDWYSSHPDIAPFSSRVLEYLKTTGQDPDELVSGWCSGFVAWGLKENGYEYPRDNSPRAWETVTTSTEDPAPGDLVDSYGHIAFFGGFFFDHAGRKMFLSLGGSQAGRVCILAIPASHMLHFYRPIRAPKGWIPSPTMEQLSIEATEITVKNPEPQFTYPDPDPRKR